MTDCDCRRFTHLFQTRTKLDDRAEIQAIMLAYIKCKHFNNFVRGLNKYQTDKNREQKAMEDPSANESSKKAWK